LIFVHRRWLVFSTATLAVFACVSALGAQTTSEFTVQEVWSTDGDQVIADGMTSIRGLVETPDGRIWIVDNWPDGGRVLRLDPETKEAAVAGREGQGPGEVRRPTHMTIGPEGRVAVFDAWSSRIEIYEPDGEPFGRVQLEEPVIGEKGFAALASGGYALTAYLRSSGDAIHYFHDSGTRLRGWQKHPLVPGAPAPGAPWQNDLERNAAMAQIAGSGGWIHARADGTFLYSQAAPHEITLFEAPSAPGSGWVERPVVSMPDLFEAPGLSVLDYTTTEDGQTFVGYDMTWPRSVAVFELSSGHILNIVVMEKEGQSLWQLFEPQDSAGGKGAELVGQATVDRVYTPWSLCENDDVLASVRDPATDVAHAVRLRIAGDFRSP